MMVAGKLQEDMGHSVKCWEEKMGLVFAGVGEASAQLPSFHVKCPEEQVVD